MPDPAWVLGKAWKPSELGLAGWLAGAKRPELIGKSEGIP